ncbi:uncharacterized protein [Dermacentor albipictus]|uniref:uncharacterized protein n=1 Tax=Dermacentor albipictus TaxID=60249 RepID=UPI0031FCB459
MHSSRTHLPALNGPQPPPMQEGQPVFTQPRPVLLSAPNGDQEKHVKSSADHGGEVSVLALATSVTDTPTGAASHRRPAGSDAPSRRSRARRAPRRRASRATVLCCCLMSCLAVVALASASCIVLALVRNDERTYALAWRLIGEFFADAAGTRRKARPRQREPAWETTTPTTTLTPAPPLYALFRGIGNSSIAMVNADRGKRTNE